MNTLRPFKILSIDGGGIRGLYSARMLEVFEQRFSTRTVDQFDMICGTSTGGLIALALAIGIPATRIREFYEVHGPRIFPSTPAFTGLIRQTFGRGKYSNEVLRTVLQDMLGDKRIRDSECLLCIPSYSITQAKPYIFRWDHPEGKLGRDNSTLCVDVALATSAAPTFFPIVEIEHSNHERQQLIDGGICANNPSLVGLMEAVRYFAGPDTNTAYDAIEILSIETLNPPTGRPEQKRLAKGVIQWREDLVSVFMEGQARMTDFVMNQLCTSLHVPARYVRITSPTVPVKDAALLSLDNAKPEALRLLRSFGNDQAQTWAVRDELRRFYETPKTYLTNQARSLHGRQ